MKMIFFGLCLVFSLATFAQDVEMDLWENEPPGSILNEDYIEENSSSSYFALKCCIFEHLLEKTNDPHILG